jgi:hypothetical protein
VDIRLSKCSMDSWSQLKQLVGGVTLLIIHYILNRILSSLYYAANPRKNDK